MKCIILKVVIEICNSCLPCATAFCVSIYPHRQYEEATFPFATARGPFSGLHPNGQKRDF